MSVARSACSCLPLHRSRSAVARATDCSSVYSLSNLTQPIDRVVSIQGVEVLIQLTAGHRPSADAFAMWVAPHWSAMTGLALRLCRPPDVDDVVQEALTVAWKQWERYDPARGTARSWLLALTADQAKRTTRHRRWSMVSVAQVDEAAVEQVMPDADVERALDKLSNRQRLAVELYYYLGLPVGEVAQTMGCAEGTVKSTLADARASLRRALGADFYEG
jgi:RNA polymerase sigma factor (sigma-70 family)